MNLRIGSFLVMLAGLGAVIVPLAAQEKNEKAGDAGVLACVSCHEASHQRVSDMWKASGHSKSLAILNNVAMKVTGVQNKPSDASKPPVVLNNSQAAPADCYGCHSDEGFKAKLQGKKIDIAQKESFNPVTCTTCHDPQHGKNSRKMVVDAEDLCSSCHAQRAVLEGKGGKGIDETRSFHSAVDCVSCHMTEGNHFMKVIRPDDPEVSEKRLDTCTTCHKDNNRKARASQLQEWQETYKKEMDPLQADMNAINAALKEKPNLLNDALKTKLSNVRTNLSMLARDGSRGAHNVDFTSEIVSSAGKDLREIKSAIKQ